jgi:hypothetical protein
MRKSEFPFFRSARAFKDAFSVHGACYVLVVISLVTSITSRLLFNGSVYGFDFGLYQPDGAHYTFRTLTFLGLTDSQAAIRVIDWYNIYSVDTKNLTLESLVPGSNPLWGLSLPRFVYPGLSVLPVLFFGIPGMLFVPIASLIVVIFVIQYLAIRVNKPILGFLLCFSLLASPTFLRWMIANCTDSLLTGLFAIYLFVYLKNPKPLNRRLLNVSLIFLTSFTRFCLPIWIAIFLAEFIKNKKGRESVGWLLLSSAASLPAVIMQPGGNSAFLPEKNGSDFFEKLVFLPISFARVGFIEIAELAAIDRILLLILAIGAISAVKHWGSVESIFFIFVLFSVWTLGALNGVLGVNFRYQMPLIPFLAWIVFKGLPEMRISGFSRDKK